MMFCKSELVIKEDPKIFLMWKSVNISNMIECLEIRQLVMGFFGYNKKFGFGGVEGKVKIGRFYLDLDKGLICYVNKIFELSNGSTDS